jgi:hypothetical protein
MQEPLLKEIEQHYLNIMIFNYTIILFNTISRFNKNNKLIKKILNQF